MTQNHRFRGLGPRFLVYLALAASLSTGATRAAQTTLHLKVVDWNVPPGTRIQATVKARLKVFFVSHQGPGADGKAKAALQSPIDELAPETLKWEVVTQKGARASKEMGFTFPVDLAGLQQAAAGEVFEIQFEVSDPGKAAGQWQVARADSTELGLFLDGDQVSHPTACIRFTKDDSGYGISIAYECSAESFAAVESQSSTCPTCGAGKGGS